MLKNIGIIFVILAVLLITIVMPIAYNQWAYNDWTCIFKKCVQVNNE